MNLRTRYLETAKHAVVFGAAALTNKLVGFFLIPLYTDYLEPADYGLMALLSVTAGITGVLFNMGFSSAIFRSYFAAEDDVTRRNVVSTAVLWMTGVVAVGLLVLLPASGALSGLISGQARYRGLLTLVIITEGLGVISNIPLAVFRAKKQSLRYGMLGIARFIVGAALNVYFVAFAQKGVAGVITAGLINTSLFAVVSLVLIRSHLSFSFSQPALKAMLSFGLPLVPSALAYLLLNSADRYLLKHFVGRAEVGLYSLGYSFGSMINVLLAQPFQLIWAPAIFESQNRPDPQGFYSRMLTYGALVAGWVALGLSLLGKEVVAVMANPKFFRAYEVIPFIAYSYVCYMLYFIFSAGIYVTAKTYYTPWIVVGAMLLNVLLNYLLIPGHGITGAGLASLISYAFLAGTTWMVSRKLYPVHYEWKRIGKIAVAIAIVLCVGRYVSSGILLSVVVKLALLAGFWVLLFLFRFFGSGEMEFLRALTRKCFRRR